MKEKKGEANLFLKEDILSSDIKQEIPLVSWLVAPLAAFMWNILILFWKNGII